MSSFLLGALTQPLGQQIFCEFFNDGQVPLPPFGSAYFITEDNADYFLTEDDLFNFITE